MRVFALVFALVTVSLAGTAQFNPFYATECVNGCAFENRSIWVNEILPLPTDGANISFPAPGMGFIYIDTIAPIQFTVFTLINASLQLRNTTLTLQSANVDANSDITLFGKSELLFTAQVSIDGKLNFQDSSSLSTPQTAGAYSFLNLNPTGSLVFTGSASLAWEAGDCIFNGILSLGGPNVFHFCQNITFGISNQVDTLSVIQFQNLLVLPNATVRLAGGIAGGFVTVDDYSKLNVNNIAHGQFYISDSAQMILNDVLDGQIHNKEYTGSSSLTGGGYLIIGDSVVSINDTGVNDGFEGTIHTGGTSLLSVSNFNIRLDTSIIVLGSTNNLTLIGNNINYTPLNPSFDGQIIAQGKKGITLNGDLTVDGYVSIVNSALTLNGTLQFAAQDDLRFSNSKISVISGSIFSDLTIDNTSSLAITGPITFNGDIDNYGLIQLSMGDTLTLAAQKYFTQFSGATLSVELVAGASPALVASNGSINLVGNLKYSLNKTPLKDTTFTIATANIVSATGELAPTMATAASGSTVTKDLPIRAGTQSIVIEFNFNPVQDLPKWVWAVVVGGGVVVILIVVLIAVKCRRKGYKPL